MAKRFQFRLRTLLLAFVPVSVIALPVGYYVRRPGLPMLIPVTGIVTLDGVPLDGAVIVFDPLDRIGISVIGTTDLNGRLRLHTCTDGKKTSTGTYPGSYRVAVAKIEIGQLGNAHSVKLSDLIPESYANPATSGLMVEVTRDGHNVFTFDLTTP